MLYPKNISDKLGFTAIKALLKELCLSSMAAALVDRIQLINNFELLEKLLRQTLEFKEILQNDSPFPSNNYLDIKVYLDKIKPENSFLTEEETHKLWLVLKTVFQIVRFFNERQEQYQYLQLLIGPVELDTEILGEIDAIIDDKGHMRPNASPLLADLQHQIQKAEQESRRRLDGIFREAIKEGWVADGSLTIRDGRMVIPLLAEYKRRLKGYIHDESATGQTVFIEPAEVFELNNRVRDLQFELRREIVRILIDLSDNLRPYIPLLESYRSMLTKIDFIRAKALLAVKLEAEMPKLLNQPVTRLYNARHPLLWLSHKETGQSVMPLSIVFGEEHRVVLVSGPNAGGKSVCLKTVGLLQLMLQSGLLVPASEHSEMGVYRKILTDIGDDQSIESDLSTYSAHLSKMREFVAQANEQTMVLIDEFGTGTDPQFGGPMAEAVLENINDKKVRGVITTHYSNLKLFAANTAGLVNASMLFDNKNLKPLYQLEIGKPGSSYAFEIARKIGLPENIIRQAKEKAGSDQNRLDTLLVQLEREKKKIFDLRLTLKREQKNLQGLLDKNRELNEFYEGNKKQLLKEAKEEAKNIIASANKLVENTIQQIKTSKADKELTKSSRLKLKDEYARLSVKEKPIKPPKPEENIEPGMWVKLVDNENAEGEVISVSKGNAVVVMGDLRTVVKLNRLQKASNKKKKNTGSTSYSAYHQHEASNFTPDVDLRGMRGEEALAELESILDRALMLGVGKLRIIHGKGDGILRTLIRKNLRQYPHVSKMEDEHPDRGGDGITYVYLE